MALNAHVDKSSIPRATAPPEHANADAAPIASTPARRLASSPLMAADDPCIEPGVVCVVAPPRRRGRAAVCTCGWSGRQRSVVRALAVEDAWTHAALTGCHPSVPLVVPTLPPSDAHAVLTGHASPLSTEPY
jgi:hypothetical protein